MNVDSSMNKTESKLQILEYFQQEDCKLKKETEEKIFQIKEQISQLTSEMEQLQVEKEAAVKRFEEHDREYTLIGEKISKLQEKLSFLLDQTQTRNQEEEVITIRALDDQYLSKSKNLENEYEAATEKCRKLTHKIESTRREFTSAFEKRLEAQTQAIDRQTKITELKVSIISKEFELKWNEWVLNERCESRRLFQEKYKSLISSPDDKTSKD